MFTRAQSNAMNNYFCTGVDWNALPEDDALFGVCLNQLIKEYNFERADQHYPLRNYISQTAQRLLKEVRAQGNLKTFFSEHVVTTLEQVKDLAVENADAAARNQLRHFICLIPCNKDTIIDQRIMISDGASHPIRGSREVTIESVMNRLIKPIPTINRLYLLLDPSFKNEEVSLREEMPNGEIYRSNPQTLLGTYYTNQICRSIVQLPNNRSAAHKEITRAIGDRVELKFRTLPQDRLTWYNRRDLAVAVGVVAVLAGCFFTFKRK